MTSLKERDYFFDNARAIFNIISRILTLCYNPTLVAINIYQHYT
ncbi:Uncharacterised protein [Staphylococcus aureus]|nr:Uncharacterised protein [Staphylococcus aureus]